MSYKLYSLEERETDNRLRKNLRNLRTRLNLSQRVFGQPLGLPQTTIEHMESGNGSISAARLNVIAKHYNTSVQWLLEKE
ncbi:MAG: helix-turn-helix transcriptional regulator [Sneathiella sp.]